MAWQWIEGDAEVPDFTEPHNVCKVLIKGRLVAQRD